MIEEHAIVCPYCGESESVLIDGSAALDGDTGSDYVEDCAVCCRPIRFVVEFDPAGRVLTLAALTDAE